MKTLATIIVYLLIIYGLALLTSCSKTAIKVHSATVLENGEHTFIYGDLKVGDTVWANLYTHEVDIRFNDCMSCVIDD